MAIQLSVSTNIGEQQATSSITYCYLYEPLNVIIEENANLTPTKIYIELRALDTEDPTTIVESIAGYAEYDVNPNQPLKVDLMKIARQHHDANLYKFGTTADIVGTNGWKSVVSQYVYEFRVSSDVSATIVSVKKLPIIGGRTYDTFTPLVEYTQDLTEAEVEGVTFFNRFPSHPYFIQALRPTTSSTLKPTIVKVDGTTFTDVSGGYPASGQTGYPDYLFNVDPCGGYLIWKSKLGGWMQWGFTLGSQSKSRSYEGGLQVGMFESTADYGGDMFVPVDYTGISTSRSRTMKSLSLNSKELEAVSGILESPAVYVVDSDGSMELMRVTSATTPRRVGASGGDFSVSLKSISSVSQKTR
tara:strand:+ start:1760 stop:2833 length:1074 start_codon:yes stop_codon:yes gene_type:complete